MTEKTAIQRIKELDQERATLFEQAKEEALRRASQAVEDLNALGLNYRLVVRALVRSTRKPARRALTKSVRRDRSDEARIGRAIHGQVLWSVTSFLSVRSRAA